MSSRFPAWAGDVEFLNSNTDEIPLSTLTPIVDSLRKAQPTSWRHLDCILRFHAPFRLSNEDEEDEDDKGASAASPNANALVKSLPDSPASALETIIATLVRFLMYNYWSRHPVFTYCCLMHVVRWFRSRKVNI